MRRNFLYGNQIQGVPDQTKVSVKTNVGSSLHEDSIQESLEELLKAKGSLWVMQILEIKVKQVRDGHFN